MSEDIKVVDRRWWAKGEGGGADAAETSNKPSYVEELERKLKEKDAQIEEFLSKYRNASHDFDESRARLRKETSKEIERGRRAVIVELLEVLDNLDRAIDAGLQAAESGESSPAFERLLQGIALVHQQFLAKLEGLGVTRLEVDEHTIFDPARHEAVGTVPVPTVEHDGRILGIVAHGYMIGDEVIRPAAVAVGRLSPAGSHSG
jgi:molecular chaperone GrpE